MGLISQEVEVKIGTSNYKYYESLGYKIPKKINKYGKKVFVGGSIIKVNVNDLTPCCETKVEVKCDYCGKIFKTSYLSFNTNKRDDLYYYHKCSMKVYSISKIHQTDQDERNNIDYIEFIKKVISRDNHTCHCCGKVCNNDIKVHHLNGYNWFKEGRTDDQML